MLTGQKAQRPGPGRIEPPWGGSCLYGLAVKDVGAPTSRRERRDLPVSPPQSRRKLASQPVHERRMRSWISSATADFVAHDIGLGVDVRRPRFRIHQRKLTEDRARAHRRDAIAFAVRPAVRFTLTITCHQQIRVVGGVALMNDPLAAREHDARRARSTAARSSAVRAAEHRMFAEARVPPQPGDATVRPSAIGPRTTPAPGRWSVSTRVRRSIWPQPPTAACRRYHFRAVRRTPRATPRAIGLREKPLEEPTGPVSMP